MNARNKKHHIPTMLKNVRNSELFISDTAITKIFDKYNRTPLYIYSKDIIKERISLLRNALPDEISLHYAVKANPMIDVVKYTASIVDGLDVASGNELKIALQTDADAKDISFAGPGKSEWELTESILSGITINVESELEFNRIIKISEKVSRTPNIALRINPDFELKSSGMKMSGGPKPFGVDAEIAPALLKKIAASNANFMGFHIFSGSQNLSADAIIESQTKTFSLARNIAHTTKLNIKKLNIGGGFGIPYFPGEVALDLEPISQNLERLLEKYKNDFSDTEIIIELGRYIVGEAGLYACGVIDKKISRGTTYLITNGGLHHHLAASGNFGQVIRKNYPVTIANKIGANTEKVSIVGPLCTPLDILASDMELPKAEVGDLVAVFQSGAYGYSASPHNFLSHPSPKEIFI